MIMKENIYIAYFASNAEVMSFVKIALETVAHCLQFPIFGSQVSVSQGRYTQQNVVRPKAGLAHESPFNCVFTSL